MDAPNGRDGEAIRLREEDYHSLWATSINPVLVADDQWTIRLANPACAKVFGYSPGELIGKNIAVLQPEHAARNDENGQAWLLPSNPGLFDARPRESVGVHRDGHQFPVTVALTRLLQGDRAIHVAFVHDISDRKEAESAVREKEERYRALVENFPCGNTTIFDRDFRVIFVGGDDARQYGPPETFVGKLLRDIAPPETCAAVEPSLRRAFQGEKVTYETPYTGGSKYRAIATPLLSKDGAITEVMVVAANITEQERAQAALRESEERFRLLAEVTNDAIWDWDLITNLLWWNEGFETLFGYSRADIEKTIDSWYNRVHPAERGRVISGLHRVIDEGGTTWSDEYRFLCKNGSYAYVLDRGQVIRNSAGKAVRMVGGMRDLTERNEAEAASQAFPMELLKAQDEERRRIARELHDSTAQELAVVQMNLGRLEEWIEGRDAWAENLLADSLAVLAQGNRELRTLAHLLHPPMLEELGLLGALRDYVEGFSARSGIKVQLDASPNFQRCSADIETALFRIVQESLANVHRHSGSKVAQVRLVRSGEAIELTIADEGRGLPNGLLTGSAENARVGVGISGMRQRIVQLQGRLDINSDRRGTTVRAVLPLSPTTAGTHNA